MEEGADGNGVPVTVAAQTIDSRGRAKEMENSISVKQFGIVNLQLAIFTSYVIKLSNHLPRQTEVWSHQPCLVSHPHTGDTMMRHYASILNRG